MAWNEIKTRNGYNLLEVASALQKSIRRCDKKVAGWCALELFHSGYWKYAFTRLLTISAEDCHGVITQEVKALRDSFLVVNDGKREKVKGRIFLSKAVLLLCDVAKNRDADHLQCFTYDKKVGISDAELKAYMDELVDVKMEVPEYTFDCHTARGKRAGATKDQFFQSEQKALKPKARQRSFDFVLEKK